MAWRIATRNLGLLSTLVLVRLLRPEDFGLVALASGFANAVDSLSAIGVQDALIRETSPGRDMYDTAFSLNALRGGVTAIIIVALAWPAAGFFSEPRLVSVMLALAASMLISAFENIGTIDFRRDFAFHKEFNLQVVSRIVGVVSTIALAIIWRSYWALVVGLLMARVARLVQSYTMSAYRPRVSLRSWHRLIGFSLWTWLLTVLLQIRDRGDSVIIGRMLGTAQFGVFSIGSELGALPVTEVVEPLCRTLFSGFALLHRSSESPTRLYLGAVEIAVMLIFPAGIGISMVADPMVRVALGTQWLNAVPVIQIIAVISTISVFGNFSSTFLSAGGRPRATFLISSVSIAIRIPLMVALVYGWGLPGAAVGVGITLMIDQGLFLWRTMRHLTITIRDLLSCTWRAAAASLAMAGCMAILGMAWTPGNDAADWSNAKDLAARCAIGAVTYTVSLIAAWFLAGRPDGIERQILTIARNWLGWRTARS